VCVSKYALRACKQQPALEEPAIKQKSIAPFRELRTESVWLLLLQAFNFAWPQRVRHHSPRARVLYILGKLVFIPCLYAAVFFITGFTWTHLVVSGAHF